MASNLPRTGYRGPRYMNSDKVLLVVLILAMGFLLGYWAGKATAAEAEPVEAVVPVAPIPETVLARVVEPVKQPEPVPEPIPTPEPDPAVEEINVPPLYTEEELEMMALVIYQEAGGDACSDDTRLKVGTVVMNRVADDRPWLPDTIEEVLLQKGQYGRLYWTGLVWPERAALPQEAHAVARAYECAERILSGERYLPEDVIFQSEHIMGEIVAEQDGFYFCR